MDDWIHIKGARQHNLQDCDVDIPEMEPRLFSFNSPQGACEACSGLGFLREVGLGYLTLDRAAPTLSVCTSGRARQNKQLNVNGCMGSHNCTSLAGGAEAGTSTTARTPDDAATAASAVAASSGRCMIASWKKAM